MKSLEKLKNVLQDVEINEEQRKALDSFFEELYENLKEKALVEVQNENAIYSQEDLDSAVEIAMEEAEAAFELAMSDAEAAFDLFQEDAEEAFNAAMSDAEVAFELFEEDITKQHTENMTKALEDIYESLLEKAKEEVLSSPQFESLNKIKEILTPFIIEESNSESLLKENKKLKEALRFLHEEKETLERDQIIESLISELPNKEKLVIRNYIEEAKTVDEIYERYNLAISILEAKEEEQDEEELEDQDIVEDEEDNDEDEIQAESVIYSESKIEKVNNVKPKRYASIEEAIISSVFK